MLNGAGLAIEEATPMVDDRICGRDDGAGDEAPEASEALIGDGLAIEAAPRFGELYVSSTDAAYRWELTWWMKRDVSAG